MIKRMISTLLLALFTLPILAQGEPAVQSAITAAQTNLNITTRPSNWSYQILGETSNNNLDCPLVANTADLGQKVTPYRIQLTFGEAVYIVHASQDGSMVVLCDSKFALSAEATPSSGNASTATPNNTNLLSATVTNDQVQTILNTMKQYPCPPNFSPNYLVPNIVTGLKTARVEPGGSPNRIRTQPNTDFAIGAQVGQIQPNTVIDQVIGGPACSGTYVWWHVKQGNLYGWTVESDSSSGDRFLQAEPGGTEIPFVTSSGIPATPLAGWQQNLRAGSMVYLPNGHLVVRGTNDQDASDTLYIFDENGQTVSILAQPSGSQVQQLFLTPDTTRLVVVGSNRKMSVYDSTSLVLLREWEDVFGSNVPDGATLAGVPGVVAFSTVGIMVTSGCNQFDEQNRFCNLPVLNVSDLRQNAVIGTIPIAEEMRNYVDLLISQDGGTLLIFARPKSLLVDLATLEVIGTIPTSDPQMAFSGATNAAFGVDNNLSLVNVYTVACNQFNPQSGCAQSEVSVWEPTTGKRLRAFSIPASVTTQMVANVGESIFLAIGDMAGNVVLHNLSSGSQAMTSPVVGSSIYGIAFSVDGTKLAISNANGVYIVSLQG